MTNETQSYGEYMRVILEVPILRGVRTEDITDDDRESAAIAAISLLRHNSPRVRDVNDFNLASIGIYEACPQCDRPHRVKPFRGKAADRIFAAAKASN